MGPTAASGSLLAHFQRPARARAPPTPRRAGWRNDGGTGSLMPASRPAAFAGAEELEVVGAEVGGRTPPAAPSRCTPPLPPHKAPRPNTATRATSWPPHAPVPRARIARSRKGQRSSPPGGCVPRDAILGTGVDQGAPLGHAQAYQDDGGPGRTISSPRGPTGR